MFGAFIVVCGGLGFAWWSFASSRVDTDDSFVEGHITNVSSRVQGVVTQVLVKENQLVHAGDTLVVLDDRDYATQANRLDAAEKVAEASMLAAQQRITQSTLTGQGEQTVAQSNVSSAQADIAHAQETLRMAQAEEQTARAHVKEEQAQLAFAHSDMERYKQVYEQGGVSKQQYDKSVEEARVAHAQLDQARSALDQVQKKIGQARADVAAAMAREAACRGQLTNAQAKLQQPVIDKSEFESEAAAVQQAKFDLQQAKLNLSYTRIVAPVTGRVGHKSVEIGQRVEVGQALMAIVPTEYWVTANFKETQLAQMKPGQKVEVTIDAIPGHPFEGRVDSFSPASGAKFSLLPPENASGNFTKVVQRIPVKVNLDAASVSGYADRIAPGMSCTTTVFVK
jgi:membrane fusion protein (multidrug efflux system)